MATVTLGTGELAVAGTAIAGGTAVRYAGELGAGGKGKAPEKAVKDARMATAEARSGIPRETVMKHSGLPEKERFELAESLIGHELTEDQKKAIRKIHGTENGTEAGISKGIYKNDYPEIRAIVKELDQAGFSRAEGRKLMENGVLGISIATLKKAQNPDDFKNLYGALRDR